MATPELFQQFTTESVFASPYTERLSLPGTSRIWMVADALTVLFAVTCSILYELQADAVGSVHGLLHATLFEGRSAGLLLALLLGYMLTLILLSRSLNLYWPMRLASGLHEQRLNAQACFGAGLLLTGALYLIKAEDVPRSVVILTVTLVGLLLGVRRFVYRMMIYRRFERGIGTRNVLIVGTGPGAHALRHHLERVRRLGYTFKGFLDFPGNRGGSANGSPEVIGSVESIFQQARRQFVDEIFVAGPMERGVLYELMEQARLQGVDLRVVPEMYDGLAWTSSIEYIGQFPTIPLHRGHVPEIGLAMKRLLDIVFSATVLILMSPLLSLIALAIKLDSKGPVFYSSERIGKKGRRFRCIKFRTMVSDAERRRAEIMHMNERDGVLFKITNDPRITKLGRILRKYSLDELPQFFNVLRGDMSVVGPRPPIASEVKQYKLDHLRRLDVTPGVTGLWQVQGRQDPSFDSYVSLDVSYIENWSLWLDIKIIVRTVGVVFSGTGS